MPPSKASRHWCCRARHRSRSRTAGCRYTSLPCTTTRAARYRRVRVATFRANLSNFDPALTGEASRGRVELERRRVQCHQVQASTLDGAEERTLARLQARPRGRAATMATSLPGRGRCAGCRKRQAARFLVLESESYVCVRACVCFSVCFDTRPRQSSPGIPPYTCAMHRSIVRAFIRANGSHDATCAGLVSPTSHEADEESPPPTSGSLDSMLDYLVATKLSFEICTPRSLITAVSSRLSD